MKVILMSDYGFGYLPKGIGRVDFSNFLWRIDKEIIDKIEKVDWVDFDKTFHSDGRLYRYTYTDGTIKYLFPNPDSPNNYTSISIVEVDTSRPWYVDNYDGAESIKYIDNYFCVSKEANFHIIRN